jgi:hypothetical protein
MNASCTPESLEEHCTFLTETLIPDLRESGTDATADDFELCVRMLHEQAWEIRFRRSDLRYIKTLAQMFLVVRLAYIQKETGGCRQMLVALRIIVRRAMAGLKGWGEGPDYDPDPCDMLKLAEYQMKNNKEE